MVEANKFAEIIYDLYIFKNKKKIAQALLEEYSY